MGSNLGKDLDTMITGLNMDLFYSIKPAERLRGAQHLRAPLHACLRDLQLRAGQVRYGGDSLSLPADAEVGNGKVIFDQI